MLEHQSPWEIPTNIIDAKMKIEDEGVYDESETIVRAVDDIFSHVYRFGESPENIDRPEHNVELVVVNPESMAEVYDQGALVLNIKMDDGQPSIYEGKDFLHINYNTPFETPERERSITKLSIVRDNNVEDLKSEFGTLAHYSIGITIGSAELKILEDKALTGLSDPDLWEDVSDFFSPNIPIDMPPADSTLEKFIRNKTSKQKGNFDVHIFKTRDGDIVEVNVSLFSRYTISIFKRKAERSEALPPHVAQFIVDLFERIMTDLGMQSGTSSRGRTAV